MSLSPRPERQIGEHGIRTEFAADAERAGEGVRRLDGGDDPLGRAQQAQRLHRLVVGRGDVLRAADRGEPRVLGPDARVVQAGRDRVGFDGLPVLVLEDEGSRAVQDAGAAALDRGGMARGVDPVAGGLDAVEPHAFVIEEGVEHADRVRAAADARDDGIREPADLVEELRARLFADDLLEVAHHRGERMRSRRRAEDVVRRLDARDPVAVRVVDGVLEGARARLDRDDLGAEQAHAGDVERLTLGVDLAHVDRALEAEEGCRRGGRHPVLARAGLGDHARLAEALGEQRLAEDVVDLVGAGVVEVLALEEDARAPGVLREPRHLGQDRGPAGVRAQQVRELVPERRVGDRGLVDRGELVDRGDERLRHVPAAEFAEERSGCLAQRHCARLQECAEGGHGIARDERLADEHDIRPCRAVVRDIGGGEHGRLRDLHRIGRDAVDQPAEQVAVELERRQIARVDADEPRADVRGARDLVGRVRLDERRHAQLERQRDAGARGRPARAPRR